MCETLSMYVWLQLNMVIGMDLYNEGAPVGLGPPSVSLVMSLKNTLSCNSTHIISTLVIFL